MPLKINKFKTAFTLVELLVVIAIVGILSGLIIVGMSSSTQSANVAKAQIFSNSLRNSLLMNLVSEWKFDGDTNDNWGANNCTWNGSGGGANTSASWRSASECIYGQCLNLDGTDDYLSCGNGVSTDITGPMTMEGWIKPSVLREQYFIAKFPGDTVTSGYNFLMTSTGLYFRIGDGTTRYQVVINHGMSINNWYHVAAVYDGSAMKMYKNGSVLPGSTAFSGTIATNTNPLIIGKQSTNNQYFFSGNIDQFRIYNKGMPSSMIKEQYYAGLNNLLAIKEITKEEYAIIINDYE